MFSLIYTIIKPANLCGAFYCVLDMGRTEDQGRDLFPKYL